MMRRTKDERKNSWKDNCTVCRGGNARRVWWKTGTTPDDYATNDGYITTETAGNSTGGAQSDTTSGTAGISKENIKVGVLYISDPDEGSGYSYTHDLGIVGMQENLGLSDDQIERKIVDDSDAKATEEAIEACISDGCNIIFTTSWGYMETTAEMAENIRIFTFPMEPVICQMERTSTIILVVFTR